MGMMDQRMPRQKKAKTQRGGVPCAVYEYGADFLSIFFIASGMFLSFLSVSYWDITVPRALLLVFLMLCIFFILQIRWWITPALLLLFGVVFLFMLYFTDSWDIFSGYVESYVQWVLAGAPVESIYAGGGSALLLQFFVTLCITLLVFLIVRCLFSYFLLIAVILGLFTYVAVVFSWKELDLTLPTLLASTSMLILLPRVYARYITRGRKGDGRGSPFIKKQRSPAPRGMMQLSVLPLCLLLILLTQLFLPQDTTEWKSRQLDNAAQDLADYFGNPYGTASEYSANFNLPAFGFELFEGRLGGPVTPDTETVLRVDSSRPLLLKGAVYDEYTGYNWRASSQDGDFRYDGLLMDDYKSTAFDRRQPFENPEAQVLYDTLTENISYKVRYIKGGMRTLFTSGRLLSPSLADKDENSQQMYFNARSELYTHERIPIGSELTVNSVIWKNSTEEGFFESFLQLEALALQETDDAYEDIAARYTALPDSLPQDIYDWTQFWLDSVGAKTPAEKALILEMIIGANFRYTLSPVAPPEGMDFVEHFLQSGEGYCVYFASAMAVMARSAGIPARYVTGFGLRKSVYELFDYVATGETAHAWVELYFHGIGWVQLDPLRWNRGNPLQEAAENDGQNAENEENDNTGDDASSSIEATPEPTAPADEVLPDGDVNREEGSAYGFLAVPAVLVIAAAILILLYFRLRGRKERSFALSRILEKAGDPHMQLQLYLNDIMKQLSLLGYRSTPPETLRQFCRRVDRQLVLQSCTLSDICAVYMRSQFGGIVPEAAEIEKTCSYHEKLELLLREKLGRMKYFFRRAVR